MATHYLHTPRSSGTIAMIVHRIPAPVKTDNDDIDYNWEPTLLRAAQLIFDHNEDARYHRWEISAHSEWDEALWLLERISGTVYATKRHNPHRPTLRDYTVEIVPALDYIGPANKHNTVT